MKEEHPGSGIQYYKDGFWTGIEFFSPLPQQNHDFSAIVADGRLYAGKKSTSDPDFFMYNTEENKWIAMQQMTQATRCDHMVHLDGFIYAIGKDSQERCNLERYDVTQNRWDTMQSPPHQYIRRRSVVTFKGMIFAIMTLQPQPTDEPVDELLIYHPNKNIWQRTGVNRQWVNIVSVQIPFLFIHKERCYRIVIDYTLPEEYEDDEDVIPVTTVNILDVQFKDDDDAVTCTVGDDIKQDPKPAGEDIFCIHDEVFVYGHNFVYNAGTKSELNHQGTNAVERWCRKRNLGTISSNIVIFTFDRRKIRDNYFHAEN